MEIVGIAINDVRYLPFRGTDNSSGYYRSFMNYCIDNYFDRIIMTPELNHWFSLAPNDPELGSGVFYGRIEDHHGVHYSTHNGTAQKIRNINKIGELLRIDVLIHIFE